VLTASIIKVVMMQTVSTSKTLATFYQTTFQKTANFVTVAVKNLKSHLVSAPLLNNKSSLTPPRHV
jgi:hypothetical protein